MRREKVIEVTSHVSRQVLSGNAENARVAAVRATGLMGIGVEEEFNQLAELAAEICGAPISIVTVMGRDRQFTKATVGFAPLEMPREDSLCEVTIQQENMLVVEDLSSDPRFRDKLVVKGEPNLRFYAGVPLLAPNGLVLGTMCVMDTVPRGLRPSQRRALKVLSEQVRVRMELRVEHGKLERALQERKKMIARLSALELRYRTFLNHAPFVSFIKDEEGRFVFYNKVMADRFRITMDEWIGKDDFELWPTALATRFRQNDREVMEQGKMLERSEESEDSKGVITCWKSYHFPLRNEDGVTWLGGFAVDMTVENEQRKRLQEANWKLEKLATVDTLTGLANRRILDERIEYEYRYAVRHKTPLAVVMLDVDNFKKQNDEFGHAAGDLVLKKLGALVTSTLRATDVGARYGGEEMVILLPGATTEGALLFTGRLRKAMEATEWPNGPVRASFGVSEYSPSDRSGKRLLELADDAMYEAKRTGKNKVVTVKQMLKKMMAELGSGRAPKPGEGTQSK